MPIFYFYKQRNKALFKTILAITVLFLVLGRASAQEYDDFYFGKLIDATTGEPVVFATVRVKGKALGVISNNDGGFRIPLEFQELGDSLEISSMGYETKEISFSLFTNSISRRILLEPSTYELAEAVVTAKKNIRRTAQAKAKEMKPLSSKQIIKKAIERIPENYAQEPFSLAGYYRDYQIRNQEYINLNEALIEIFDPGFKAQDYDLLQFGLYDYRANMEFLVDSFAAKPYDYQKNDKYVPDAVFNNAIVPNELVLLFNHDAIRYNNILLYSYVDVFSRDFIRKHDFLTHFQTNYGDKGVYKIKFEKVLDRFEVKGDIYIDVDTYAIRKLDYAVFRRKIKGKFGPVFREPGSEVAFYDARFFDSGAGNAELDLLYEILVEYREFSGRMYLNYISFHNRFRLVWPPEFFIEDLIVNYKNKEVQLVLNKPSKNWRSLKPRDIRIYYGKDRLQVEGLTQVGSSTYTLDFSRRQKVQRNILRRFFKESEVLKYRKMNLEINNLVDFDGNVLGEENSELLDQFREFFSQKVIAGAPHLQKNKSYVVKSVSLGHREQPRIKAEQMEEFWMNTPLKTNLEE